MDNSEPGIWSPLEALLVATILVGLTFVVVNAIWTIRAMLWLANL